MARHVLDCFKERRHKNKDLTAPVFRVRKLDTRGVPFLLAKFLEVRDKVWEPDLQDAGSLSQLPREGPPSAVVVAKWFSAVVQVYDFRLTHHAVRRTGAKSYFSLLIPLSVIRDWGGWAAQSTALYPYLNRLRPPIPLHFKVFVG